MKNSYYKKAFYNYRNFIGRYSQKLPIKYIMSRYNHSYSFVYYWKKMYKDHKISDKHHPKRGGDNRSGLKKIFQR